jgi:tetratricopeptide (TPR) repeat protein
MSESNLTKILKYLVYAIAFIPLIIFSQYVSPFHFGKVVVFRSLVEIMVVLFLLLIWQYPGYRPRFTKVTWAFFAFALAFSIATITSVQPYDSFWGSLERMGGLWTFWHYFMFFIILTSVFRTRQEWQRLFEVSLVVAILSAFYGFGQKTDISWIVGSGNRSRIFGTIGNAALFAGYQILALFLALTLFFRKENTYNKKLFFALTAFINFVAVMMTAVRGSILGTAVGLLVFVALYSSVYHSRLARKVLMWFVIFLILFVAFALIFKNADFVKNSGYLRRITNFSPQDLTVQTRFWAWQAGLKGWVSSPKTMILGWGPENFNIPFSVNFNPKFFNGPGSETLFDRAHNMFIEILVTMGLLGLLSYLSVFVLALKNLWKKIKDKTPDAVYAIGLTSLLVAYVVHNSFIFDTSANFILFFTILGFISFLSDKNIGEAPVLNKKLVNPALMFTVTGILIIAVSVLIYKTNILQAEANFTSTRGIIAGWDGDFKGAIIKYKESISYGTPGVYEFRHRMAQYLVDYSSNKSLSPEIIEALNYAIAEVQKNADTRPLDYLPELYLSRMYIILGKGNANPSYNDKALEHSLRALKIAPTFVRTYYEVGQAYLNKKDYAKAIEYFSKAVELNPEVGISYWYLGAVQMELGDLQNGLKSLEQALNKGYGPSEGDYQRLLSVYLKLNDFDKIVSIYEKLVIKNPKNPQYRASLAVAYAKIGKIDEAVIQAKMAAQIDSNFVPEAKMFVQSLGRVW